MLQLCFLPPDGHGPTKGITASSRVPCKYRSGTGKGRAHVVKSQSSQSFLAWFCLVLRDPPKWCPVQNPTKNGYPSKRDPPTWRTHSAKLPKPEVLKPCQASFLPKPQAPTGDTTLVIQSVANGSEWLFESLAAQWLALTGSGRPLKCGPPQSLCTRLQNMVENHALAFKQVRSDANLAETCRQYNLQTSHVKKRAPVVGLDSEHLANARPLQPDRFMVFPLAADLPRGFSALPTHFLAFTGSASLKSE